jgi:hypothetical protein
MDVANLAFVEFHGDPGAEIVAQAASLNPVVFATWQGFDR